MHKYLIYSFFSLVVSGSISCAYNVEEELYPPVVCDTLNVTYSGTILPIIQQNCYDCHSDANVSISLIPLEGYAFISVKAHDGQLIMAIRHTGEVTPMPKDRPSLSECDIQKIEKWVADGAPDN
jgi:mono/diheme cytochrome c family protein